MNIADLIRFRRELRLTQPEMARALGLGARSYQDLEGQDEDTDLSRRHVFLVDRCSLTMAIERRNLMLATPAIRREARALMDLFDGRPLERVFENLPA